MNVPFSRHLSYPDGEVGHDVRRPSVDRKLISMLDREQLNREPSSREWWDQRRQGLMRVSDDQNMCPCLADMFRRQSEQLNKLISSSKSLDLRMAGQLDREQLLQQRRVSIPLDRFVAILDDQQTRKEDSFNKEMMEKVLKKMKNNDSPGPDSIPIELFKWLGNNALVCIDNALVCIVELFNCCQETEVMKTSSMLTL